MGKHGDVRVCILGDPSVVVDGVVHRVSGPLLQRLLIGLCLVAPSSLPNDVLGDLLWGHTKPPTWASSLRMHVTRLRASLLAHCVDIELEARGGGYGLAGNLDCIDAVEFLFRVERAAAVSAEQAKLVAIDHALSLWRGSIALDGEHQLIRSSLESLNQAHTTALRTRYRLMTHLGQFDEVIGALNEQVMQSAFDESLTESLLDSLIRSGRTTEAHELLRSVRKMLEEGGHEPWPGLVVAQRTLFAEDIGRRSWSQRSGGKDRLETPWPSALVGREPELAVLDTFVGSTSRILVVEGDAGTGKSRLMDEFSSALRGEGRHVVLARVWDQPAPGQLFDDILEAWSAREAGRVLGPVAAVEMCIATAAEQSQPVIILEDLHRLDLASTKLLRRLLFGSDSLRFKVILTTLPGPWKPYMRELFADIAASRLSMSMVVPRLTRASIEKLIHMRTSYRGATAWTVAGRLFDLTGGLPLLIDLVFASGVELDSDETGRKASLLADPLIAAAETNLSGPDRDLVAVAALMGARCELSVLAEVAGVTVAVATDALAAAERVGLVKAGRGPVREFPNEIVRAGLMADRSMRWKCEHHRRIAAVLRKRGRDSYGVAFQLASALPDASGAKFVDEVIAMAAGLLGESRWDAALGTAAEGSLEVGRARSYFAAAFAVATEMDDPAAMCRVAVASSGSSQPFDGDPERAGWLRRVLQCGPELPADLRVEALSEFVYLVAMNGLTDEVLAADSELQALARSLDTPRAYGLAAHAHLVTLHTDAEPARRVQLSREARRFGAAVRPEVAATPLFAEMTALLQLGRFDEAQELVAEIDAMVQALQRPGDVWLMASIRAVMFDWVGDEDASQGEALAAKTIALRHDVFGGEVAWAVYQVSRALRNGDWSVVLEITAADTEGGDDDSIFGAAIAAVISAELGETAQAGTALQAVVERLRSEPRRLGWLGSMCLAAQAASHCPGPWTDVLRELLEPYSGQFAINGLVPTSLFGPVDRYLEMLR
jgi:DNA-binding SARP family transcriptional activator